MTDTTTNPQALLFGAFAKAQGAYLPVQKNRDAADADPETGEVRTWKYADLDEVLSSVREALAENGLSIYQCTAKVTGSNALDLLTNIAHAGGGLITSCVPIPSPESFVDPKAYGAMQTLLRRYQAEALLGITSYHETGEELQALLATVAQAPAKAAPAKKADGKGGGEHYSQESFDASFPDWSDAISKGITTPQKVIATIESKAPLSDEQREKILSLKKGK